MLTIDPSHGTDALLTDIHAYITQVETQIEAREMVDLAGLDAAIEVLCKQVLTQADGARYRNQLAELMDAIEAMQSKMMALQADIATTMKSLSKQKKAALAYIKAPGVES